MITQMQVTLARMEARLANLETNRGADNHRDDEVFGINEINLYIMLIEI